MKVVTAIRFFAAILVCGFSHPIVVAEDARLGQILEEGLKSRKAAIRLTLDLSENLFFSGSGVFISQDGLALFNSGMFSTQTKPRFFNSAGKELEFGTILTVFPDQELLLMKFDHKPQVWRPVAAADPVQGDYLSIVVMDNKEILEDSTLPPMTVRALAMKTDTIMNYRATHFCRVLTVGCHPRDDQLRRMMPGTYAVNQEGQLIGFKHKTDFTAKKAFTVISLSGLSNLVEQAVDSGKELPFPLPEEEVFTDRASVDPDYSRMEVALKQGSRHQAELILGRLQKRYPRSRLVRMSSLLVPQSGNQNAAKLPVVNDADPAPIRIGDHLDRSFLLREQGDLQGAILELEAAVKISPDDFTALHHELALLYMKHGMPEKAEDLLRKACELDPNNIDLLVGLRSSLERQPKLEEQKATSQRIKELEQWYPRN